MAYFIKYNCEHLSRYINLYTHFRVCITLNNFAVSKFNYFVYIFQYLSFSLLFRAVMKLDEIRIPIR